MGRTETELTVSDILDGINGRFAPPDITRKKRCVWEVYGSHVGVIILDEWGEVWSNQAGGYDCAQPSATGRFFMLNEPVSWEEDFHDLICEANPRHGIDDTLINRIRWSPPMQLSKRDLLEMTLAETVITHVRSQLERSRGTRRPDRQGVPRQEAQGGTGGVSETVDLSILERQGVHGCRDQ